MVLKTGRSSSGLLAQRVEARAGAGAGRGTPVEGSDHEHV